MKQLILKSGKKLGVKSFDTLKSDSYNHYYGAAISKLVRSSFLILILFLSSCEKDQNSQVPYVPFPPFTINLNITNQLTIPGNSIYFPGPGFGGVIVSCLSPGEYYAYDATCTYEVSQSCKIINEDILGTCPCCGSQFVLAYEALPAKGPAAAQLRQYHVSMVNSFTLRIYN